MAPSPMEVAISAVAGEIVSRFISFLMNKYNSNSHAQLEEEKVAERLQELLIRVGTIIEEADSRYITNFGMMMQLKTLSEAMYRGYCVLDILRYRAFQDGSAFNTEVRINDSSISNLYSDIPRKRFRATIQKDNKARRMESHGAVESLEIAIANIGEFVVLLGGCERMSRRPYDVYLYTGNFMFGRHVEKQKLLSFLLENNDPPGDHPPAVLPIIGGVAVGKKSLVSHVCGDERVRSRFSSVLQLTGESFMRTLDHGWTVEGMILVIIEFASDVDDDEWKKFHTFVIRMGSGTKIIILSRLKKLARFGSVKPIFLNSLSYDELRYLFKTLAFGSVDPAQHPRLVQIADEFAKDLHMQGSLVATNAFADVLRRNLDIQFWNFILVKWIRMIKRNLSIYGVHPNSLIEEGRLVDITEFSLHPLTMAPYTTTNVPVKKQTPSVTFGELAADPSVIPKEDFILVSWKSRIPPHNSFEYFVPSHAQDTHEGSSTALPGKKRRGMPI
ncbi:unnamed protein product [Alopecurus aequalis]